MAVNRRLPAGVRGRRAVRLLRHAGRPAPVLALAIVVLLVVDLLSLGTVGPRRASRLVSARPRSASGGARGSPTSGPGGRGGAAGGAAGGATSGGATGSGPQFGAGGTRAGGGASAVTGSGPVGTVSPGGAVGSGVVGPGSAGGGAPPGVALGASDRGVTPTSIRVVFPWPNLGPVGQATGLDTSSEDNVMSIQTYVNDVNAHGGILGRKIDPEIVSFNPLDDADMRSKCLQWTQDQSVFAVVDTVAWHDDHQLCVTQEGHTPLISGWTTVPEWTQRGNPNLWWTGPDDSLVLENLVAWARGRGLLTPTTRFGIVAADREGDTLALNEDLLPALRRAGLTPADVESLHYDSSDGADSASQAPLVVTRLRSRGVTTVIPVLPFLNFSAFLNAAQNQSWSPTELLSDYESELTVSLGLADQGFTSLQNQAGPTSFVLGNSNDPRGYDAQALDCYHVWMKANPGVTPPPQHYLESTGTAMTWCQNIRLFAAAAARAGPHLTRAGFDAAMATLSGFPGTVVPSLAYGSTNRAGPHLGRTVQIHENGDGRCPLLADGKSQGSCWLILDGWSEMRRG